MSSIVEAGQHWEGIAEPDDVIYIHGPVDGAPPDSWDVSSVQTGNRMMRTSSYILDWYTLRL